MYCRMVNSSARAEFGVSIRNRSSTFTARGLLRNCNVAGSRTKMFFNTFLALDSTVPIIYFGRIGYRGSMMKWLSLLRWLSSSTRPPRMYPDLESSSWIPCWDREMGSRATCFKTMANAYVISASGNAQQVCGHLPSSFPNGLLFQIFLYATHSCFEPVLEGKWICGWDSFKLLLNCGSHSD